MRYQLLLFVCTQSYRISMFWSPPKSRQSRMALRGCILHSPKGASPCPHPAFRWSDAKLYLSRELDVPSEKWGKYALLQNKLFTVFFPYVEIWGVKHEQVLNRLQPTFMGQLKLYEAVENDLGMVLALLSYSKNETIGHKVFKLEQVWFTLFWMCFQNFDLA